MMGAPPAPAVGRCSGLVKPAARPFDGHRGTHGGIHERATCDTQHALCKRAGTARAAAWVHAGRDAAARLLVVTRHLTTTTANLPALRASTAASTESTRTDDMSSSGAAAMLGRAAVSACRHVAAAAAAFGPNMGGRAVAFSQVSLLREHLDLPQRLPRKRAPEAPGRQCQQHATLARLPR